MKKNKTNELNEELRNICELYSDKTCVHGYVVYSDCKYKVFVHSLDENGTRHSVNACIVINRGVSMENCKLLMTKLVKRVKELQLALVSYK